MKIFPHSKAGYVDVKSAKERKEWRVPPAAAAHENAECMQLGNSPSKANASEENLPKSLFVEEVGYDSDLLQVGDGQVVQDCPEDVEIERRARCGPKFNVTHDQPTQIHNK